MNKLLKHIGFCFSLSMLLNGCVEDFKIGDKFLEKAPGIDITADTIFGKAEYARRFLWDTYKKMYYGLPSAFNTVEGKMNMTMFEVLSDTWHSHLNWDEANRSYYNGAYTAGMEEWSTHTRFSYTKESCWEAIRKGWIFIEKVDDVPDMDTDEKERLKAEAKVIIASRYFDMFRHFGGLPLVDHSWGFDEPIDNPRATVEATNNFMVDLLDQAAKVLPWALEEEEVTNWDGRLTKAAAMGLKCKILLFAASPLFNDDVPYCTEEPQEAVVKHQVWTGGYKPELWTRCLDACELFFRELNVNGRYGLLQSNDKRDAFRRAYSTRGSGWDNPEMLISTRLNYNNLAYFRTGSCPGGSFTPTQEYVEMFPMSDGAAFDWNNSECVKNMFTQRDPRLFETILVNGAAFKGRKAELWVGGREMVQGSVTESGEYATGYGNFKYILDYQSSNGKPTLWPYLRMAEIHLIYAEALMKANRFDDAIDQVDKIRDRVGMKGLKVSNPTLNLKNEQVLLNEILRERACELGLEDVRLFDLIRHKLKTNFTTPLHGLRIRRADGKQESWSDKPAGNRGEYPTEFTYEKFELKNRARYLWVEKNWSPKWYLGAFPPSEVNKEYGLTQNPGW